MWVITPYSRLAIQTEDRPLKFIMLIGSLIKRFVKETLSFYIQEQVANTKGGQRMGEPPTFITGTRILQFGMNQPDVQYCYMLLIGRYMIKTLKISKQYLRLF